jgi:hypothetical protein
MLSMRWVIATLALVSFAGSIHAQVAYSDNFQYPFPNNPPPFSTTYTQVNNGTINGMQPAGTFSITSDLARDLTGGPTFQTQHAALTGDPNQHRFFDHTFGTAQGLYMAINGDAATLIYGKTGIAVTPNTDYVFSVFMNSWTFAGTPTFGRVRVNLGGNNTVIGDIGFADAPATTSDYNTWGNVALWTERTIAFNSGNNTLIDLNIFNVNTEIDGNDYSIDDISIAAVPEPTAVALGGLGALGIGTAVYTKIQARRRRKLLAKKHAEEAKKA